MDDAARIPRVTNASIAPWVTFGAGCIVRDFAVVGRVPSVHGSLARVPPMPHWLRIGRDVEIGCHAIIYAGATIGDDCFIGDGAFVREGAIIGNGCVIGHGATVSYGAVLGDHVRMVDGSFVTDGARIGSNTFIGVGVVMMSDRRKEVVDYEFREEWVTPPTIGEHCLIGSGACILPGVRIGNNAVIGAGALVVKDVPDGGTVLGQPARLAHIRSNDVERQLAMVSGFAGCMTGKVA